MSARCLLLTCYLLSELHTNYLLLQPDVSRGQIVEGADAGLVNGVDGGLAGQQVVGQHPGNKLQASGPELLKSNHPPLH